ncbi:hypothetical protein ABXT21_25470, partial [Ralstonia sp. SM1864_UCD524_TZ4]
NPNCCLKPPATPIPTRLRELVYNEVGLGHPDGSLTWLGSARDGSLTFATSGVLTMKPDAIIKVRFFTTAEGGRNTAVEGQFYACPLFVEGEGQGFDCRLLLEGQRLELGSTYEVPVKFLYREPALSKLAVGKHVLLWEGRDVAKGQVIKIADEP